MKSTKLFRGLLSVIFILSFSIGFAQKTEVSNSTNPSDQLYQTYKSGGIDKALSSYNSSKAKGDEYTLLSEPLNVLGYRLMDDGDLDAAEKAFMAQIEEYPNEANPYDSYADLLMKKGDEEKAKENYQKAIELSATMDDVDAKQQMLEASKSKLAMLEGKGTDMKFLEGKWKTKMWNIQNGSKSAAREGSVEFTANGSNTILTGINIDNQGNYAGTRLIAYNALKDEYDMSYASTAANGISPSTLKVESSSPDKTVIIESYEENGKPIKIKHVMKRTGDEISWEIHDISQSDQGTLVAEMDFTKE